MSDRPQLGLRFGLALTGVALLCILAGGAALALRPPPLRSYHDVVAYTLRQRGIAYQQIEFGEIWPDNTNRQYGANIGPLSMALKVRLSDGTLVTGWVQCDASSDRCALSLKPIGLNNLPLPPLAEQQQRPAWMRWIETYLSNLS